MLRRRAAARACRSAWGAGRDVPVRTAHAALNAANTADHGAGTTPDTKSVGIPADNASKAQ